jgi:hypothetical protein
MATIHCRSCNHILSDSTYFLPIPIAEGEGPVRAVAGPTSTQLAKRAALGERGGEDDDDEVDDLFVGLVPLTLVEGARLRETPTMPEQLGETADSLAASLSSMPRWVVVECNRCKEAVGGSAWCCPPEADGLRWPACVLWADAVRALQLGSGSLEPSALTVPLLQGWEKDARAATEQHDAADAAVWLRIAHVIRAMRVGAAVLDHFQEVAETTVWQAARNDMQLERFDPAPVEVAVLRDVVALHDD